MSGSVNKAIIIGNLGKDPDVRTTQDGKQIVTLSVATSDSWKDRQTGERREKVEWHRAVIFNEHLGKVAADYLRKGSKVYLEGSLQTRKWTDQAGVEKYATEIVLQAFNGTLVLLDGKKEVHGGEQGYGSAQPGAYSAQSSGPMDEDEIPF
ncbi:single-stranded DNA-binding protein [Limnoglobus roseus]|uniref:Single-stranded DNA-binding protein n=1 Tax=Limnoglobus roseus TaxID=2598579 RepID=A0A5C1AMA9_9BACT|nr:single-stranded DNA-binding protein [Limnoglobus roseus]QEL19313.1 single-stranded DNA-binding protein [Limnoglobus roseus]